MALEVLTDITKCQIGTVNIARASTVTIASKETEVDSGSDVASGATGSDVVKQEITADIQAEDPLAIPLVLALTGAQTLLAGGRLVNGSTYRDSSVLHCVLTAFGLTIADDQVGTCNLSLQNRATAGNSMDDEWTGVSGTKQALPTRRSLIRIVSAVFTDDASASLSLLGVTNTRYQMAGQVRASNSGGDQVLCDLVDVASYKASGSLSLRDTQLGTAQYVAQRLAAMRRGTLVVTVKQTRQDDEASAAVNKVLTFQRIKFRNPKESKRTKDDESWDVDMNVVWTSALGAEMALANMVTIADA